MPRTPASLLTLFLLVLSVITRAETLTPADLKALTESEKPILFCGDKAGWPPYTYEDGDTLKGYDLDVLKKIFEPYSLSYRVHMLPWRRCLEMVKEGAFDVALSASGNSERAVTYRMSQPYYFVTPSYIYLKSRFPDGLNIPPAEITRQYKVCGLRGYSYHSFGLEPDSVETTTNTFTQLQQPDAVICCWHATKY